MMGVLKKERKSKGKPHPKDPIKCIYYGVLLLMVVSPLWNGLFNERDQLVTNLFTGILFLITLINGINKKPSLFDMAVAFFALINFIAIINGANKWLALQAALNYLGLFMIYLIIAEYVYREQEYESLLNAIFTSGVIVAAIGLLSASEIINPFGRAFDGNRIGSTFGYPNTLSAYLSVVLLIGIYLFDKVKSTELIRVIILIANYLILICLFGTQSRGGIITFSIVIIVLLIFNWKAWIKNKTLPLIICQLIIGGGIGVLFLGSIIADDYFRAWGLILIGITVLIGINYLFQRYINKGHKAENYFKAIAIPALILTFLYGITKSGIIAYNLLGRIVNLNVNDIDIYHRVIFYKDAIKLFLSSPLIGYGGGAWEAMYKTARSLPYYTTQVHNNILEIALESGLLGLLPFLGVSLLLIFKSLFAKKNRVLHLYGIVALGLFIHGIMDFDFSYKAIGIIYWSMLGAISGSIKLNELKKGAFKPIKLLIISFLIITAVFILCNCSLILSIYYNDKIVDAQKQGDLDLMLKYAEKAARLNPFAERTHMNIANIYFEKYIRSVDVEFMDKALEHVDYAIKYDRYQSDWYSTKANLLAFVGDVKAAEYYQKAISINKYDGSEYADAANIELLLAQNLLDKGNVVDAKRHLLQALEIEKMAERQEKEVPKNYPWRTEWRLKHPKLTKTIGYVYLYLGDMEKAREYFETSKKYNEYPMDWAEVLSYGYKIEAYNEDVINEVYRVQKEIERLKSIKL